MVETPSGAVTDATTKKRKSRKVVCGGLLDGTSDLALVAEYAHSANCTTRAVEYMCATGTIRAVKCGRQWRIPRRWAISYLGLAEEG